MADDSIRNNSVFTYRSFQIREEPREKEKPGRDKENKEPVERNQLRRAVGTKIQTLRAFRPRPEPGTVPAPRSTENELMKGIDLKSYNNTVKTYKNYSIEKDPEYEKFTSNPTLYGQDHPDPDHADLGIDGRKAMAGLVQYGNALNLSTARRKLVNQIIARGDTMAALRFLVYYTSFYDHDPRMNCFFKDHSAYKPGLDPNFYKDYMQLNPREINVFKSRN